MREIAENNTKIYEEVFGGKVYSSDSKTSYRQLQEWKVKHSPEHNVNGCGPKKSTLVDYKKVYTPLNLRYYHCNYAYDAHRSSRALLTQILKNLRRN